MKIQIVNDIHHDLILVKRMSRHSMDYLLVKPKIWLFYDMVPRYENKSCITVIRRS